MTADQGTRRLRVVVLGLNYAPETTGIAPYTTAFARHLAAEDHDVAVIAGHPHYPEWRLHRGYEGARPPQDDQGVRLLRVAHPVPSNPTGLSRVWMELVFAARAAIQLARQRPDVVIVVSPALLALLPALILRRPLGYRVGAWVQDLYGAAVAETGIGSRSTSRAVSFLEAKLLRQADGIIVIHEVFRSYLLAQGVPTSKIETMPNWAHVRMPEHFDRSAARRALGWGDDEVIALHAGNMGTKQGLEGLVDVARLAEQNASRIRIVLMGDGSRRARLEDYANGCNSVEIIEPLPPGDFEAALLAADCLLLHEKAGVVEMSVPSKLTTYFAAGRPIVAVTDPRSGAADLMTAAKAGHVVSAGSAEAVLSAIESVTRDVKQAEEFGTNARSYAAKHLTGAASLRRRTAWLRRLDRGSDALQRS